MRATARRPSAGSPRRSCRLIQAAAKSGADDQDRTGDLVLTKDALCQLSYIGPPYARPRRHRASARQALCPLLYWPTSRPATCRTYTVVRSRVGLANPRSCCALRWTSRSWPANRRSRSERRLERETGIEPATNSLEGCDSTTELLPPSRRSLRFPPLRRGKPAVVLVTHLRLRGAPNLRRALTHRGARVSALAAQINSATNLHKPPLQPSHARGGAKEGWWGGEGSNLRSPKAAGLQPAAIDRSATSPKTCGLRPLSYGVRVI